MVVKDDGDQEHRQHQTGGDAVSQHVPDREQRDFMPDALSLPIPPVKIIGDDRKQRAEKELQHGSGTPLVRIWLVWIWLVWIRLVRIGLRFSFNPGHFLQRTRYAPQRCLEIGQVNQRKQSGRRPKINECG